MSQEDFNQVSYEKHEKHFCDYASGGTKERLARRWVATDTVDAWRHLRMYQSLDPLLGHYPGASWLTIGDGRYGRDAHYIQEKGGRALATDISDVLLEEAKQMGYIPTYRRENAEALSFGDNEFDFVCCKESFHHFPRPMLALYEMLRVSKKGVLLIEPSDFHLPTTFFQMLFVQLREFIRKWLMRASGAPLVEYEESGNYVYRISMREMEKAALGMNFGSIAFKGLNDYYLSGVEEEKAGEDSALWQKVKQRIALYDWLSSLGLRQPSNLVTIIFKNPLDSTLKERLRRAGYEIRDLPRNPYL